MYPILLTIGDWKLRANLVFFLLSCIIGVAFGIAQAKKIEGLPSYKKIHLVISFSIGIFFAYFMGRLNGGLFTIVQQGFRWKAFAYSGLISFGAIVGGLLYGFLVSKIYKFSTGKMLDIIALILPLMESIYRIGCILMGCCFGRETGGLGGLYLPEVHGVWANRYPTQLMLLIFNFVLFLWLWRRSARAIQPGSQVMIFLIAYSVGRFLVDSFRGDMPMAGGLGYHQIVSIMFFCITSLVYVIQKIQ